MLETQLWLEKIHTECFLNKKKKKGINSNI